MIKVEPEILKEFLEITGQIRKVMQKLSSQGNIKDKAATRLQYFAMHLIEQNPGITVGELSKNVMMSSAGVAQFIERIVNAKWVKREQDENDRRITHLFLTDEGKKELKKMGDQFSEKVGDLLSNLSKDDLTDILRILRKLLTNLEEKERYDKTA